MKKDIETQKADLLREIETLPEKAQRAIYRIMKNFDLAEEMCREPDMTDAEIEKCMKYANESEDYLIFALACLSKLYRNDREPTER